MTRVRDDVRGAFDKEQAGLGDVAETRRRLFQDAMSARHRAASRGLQWAAGIAAVLIAALVITTFELVRAGSHPHTVPATTPTPRALASPTPLRNLLSVPDSTPILTYPDPALPSQMDGMTWDGRSSGKLPFVIAGPGNPANTLFGGPAGIVDRAGRIVDPGPHGPKYFAGTWADDEVHFCQMVPYDYLGANGDPATLQVVTPGGAARNVVQVGNVYEQVILDVAACSVLNDRAVVWQSWGDGPPREYWVIQLSTGKILWSHHFALATGPADIVPAGLVASRDGSLVAEIYASGSTIYGPDGKEVARVAYSLIKFNWDGSLAVVDSAGPPSPGASASRNLAVIRLSDDAVVWAAPNGYGTQVGPEVEPGGSSVAVWVNRSASQADLYLIASNGRVLAHVANICFSCPP